MTYTEVTFQVEPSIPWVDILVAQLAEIGFESFEETKAGVNAYIKTEEFSVSKLKELELVNSSDIRVDFEIQIHENKNWNQLWESDYEPVFVKDKVYVRASFHPEKPDIEYNILVDPKMSFGTAHHATTMLMIGEMLNLDFAETKVLDMGSGTGVLAILAEMMGAQGVDAIDNDTNAFENALENVQKNNCSHINVQLGAIEDVTSKYDFILANINKNILIGGMQIFGRHIRKNGNILFSGFYTADLEDIKREAELVGLAFDHYDSKEDWVMARFIKL